MANIAVLALGIAAVGVAGYFLLRKKTQYQVGDRLIISPAYGGTGSIFTIDAIEPNPSSGELSYRMSIDGSPAGWYPIHQVDNNPAWLKLA